MLILILGSEEGEETKRGKAEGRYSEAGKEGGNQEGRNVEWEGGALGSRLLTWCLGAPLRLREEKLTEDLLLRSSARGTFLLWDSI